MPTRCSLTVIDFGRASWRQVVADFDGGMVSSDAGALLLRDGQGHRVDGSVRGLLRRPPQSAD